MTQRSTTRSRARQPGPLTAALLVAVLGGVVWSIDARPGAAAALTLLAAGFAVGHALARPRAHVDGDRRLAAAQGTNPLASALAAKNVLLQEIHHRVKNQLAMISSLMNIKAETTVSSEVRDALLASRRRLESIALIHEHLHRGEQLDRVEFARYGQELVDDLRAALLEDVSPIRIETAFDRLDLPIAQAVPCALVVNELVTNALKHAFPAGRRGTISVSLREVMPRVLELAVADDGVGTAQAAADDRQTASLGLRIVSLLTEQLGGTMQQRRGPGTAIVVRFPRAPATHLSATGTSS